MVSCDSAMSDPRPVSTRRAAEGQWLSRVDATRHSATQLELNRDAGRIFLSD